jgi:MFS family permease
MPRAVWTLSGVGLLIGMGFGVMAPVLPIYVRLFGVSSFLVGLVVSVFAIVRLASNPVASRLLRHIGPRGLVIAGCLLLAVTTFLMGLSGSFASILLWRGLSGVGSAFHGVGSLALIFSATPALLRGRANALAGGGFTVGGMAGPALGGLVAQISIHAPFFFYAAMLLASAATVWLLVPPTPRQAVDFAQVARPLKELWHDRRYVAALAANFANSWQSYGVRNLLIPLFIVEEMGRTTRETGWAFTISAVAQLLFLPVAGWAADRVGRRPTLLTGLVAMAAVSSCLALSRDLVVLIGLLCVYSAAAAAAGASSQALLGDVVPSTGGPALAAFQMAGDAGLIIGPMVAGALADVLPMTAAWCVGAALTLVAAALVARVPRTRGTRRGRLAD